MRPLGLRLLTIFIIFWMASPAVAGAPEAVLFQLSTLPALAAGAYDGSLPLGELKRQGDHGLGTFHALDGEMIVTDGRFYQVKADGRVATPPDTALTPFAMVTHFRPGARVPLNAPQTWREVQSHLEGLLANANLPVAVKLTGTFAYVKTRSVPRQERPYPPLTEVVKTQPTFEFREVAGTIVGFWLPRYLESLNLPGWHCHFLTADHRGGGHLLDCRVNQAQAELAVLTQFRIKLPANGDFGRLSLTPPPQPDLHQIEK